MSTKARKTVDVAFVLAKANTYLAAKGNDWSPTAEQRQGVASLLEAVLSETGNYNGFNYQASEKNEDGSLKVGYDDSRRTYYGPRG